MKLHNHFGYLVVDEALAVNDDEGVGRLDVLLV